MTIRKYIILKDLKGKESECLLVTLNLAHLIHIYEGFSFGVTKMKQYKWKTNRFN